MTEQEGEAAEAAGTASLLPGGGGPENEAFLRERAFANAEEQESIAALREELKEELEGLSRDGFDYPHTTGDIWMLRVLRGNDSDVAKAAAWYRKSLGVRKELGLDKICWAVRDEPYKVQNLPFSECVHYCKIEGDEDSLLTPKGDLLQVERGDVQWSVFMDQVGIEKYERWQLHLHEARMVTLDRLSRERGHLVKWVALKDYSALQLPPREFLKKERDLKAKILQETSIEVLQSAFFVGVPRFFHGLWRAVKPILPARTVKKTRILGKNFAEDPEVLAEVGRPVVAKLLASHAKESEEEALSGTASIVLAGGVLERNLAVSPGQKISWVFAVGGRDDLAAANARGRIGSIMDKLSDATDVFFEVAAVWDLTEEAAAKLDGRVDEDSLMSTPVAPVSYDAASGEVSGSLVVERAGVVILRWSNAHGWVRAKLLASFEIKLEGAAAAS